MDYSKKTELRIMSHNIWCGPVYNRDLHMRDIYFRYLPDVLGLQEMTPNLYKSRIVELLEPEYELLTHKEAEGFTDNTPLLIRKGMFDVIDHGWHLFKGLNNSKTKSLAWAVLRRKSDGMEFGAISTHFWWQGGPESDLARVGDVDQMMTYVNYMKYKYNVPVVAMGDWNCRIGSLPYRRAYEWGGLDTRVCATEYSHLTGTHHPYAVYNPESGEYEGGPAPKGSQLTSIDHIFLFGHEGFDVKEYRVVLEQDALDVSDHCPIYIDCNLKALATLPEKPTTQFIPKEETK